MAQKEASHREEIEELTDELTTIRKQHDELTKLNRDQVRLSYFAVTTSELRF